MAYIFEQKSKGATFDSIYYHFLKHKVKTMGGKEWSLARIRRAFEAELRLRGREAEGLPDVGVNRPFGQISY
jgi:hypothetical protein